MSRMGRLALSARRARLLWLAWGVGVAAVFSGAVWSLQALVGWPTHPGLIALDSTAMIPIAVMLGSFDRLAARSDRLIVSTVVVGGLVALVSAVYVVVVLGFGRQPETDQERALLGLSLTAAALAAVFAGTAQTRLAGSARRFVYGQRRSPDEALQTFGSRMSRAVPMDELLLQLVETLKASMALTGAEVWTGGDGVLELAVSVPNRPSRRMVLGGEEINVVSRSRVSGNAWLQVWMPAMLAGRENRMVRVATVVHSGNLLGLIVVERAADAIAFVEEEQRVLVELSRQVGLALHNVRLDSALQASLQELQVRNAELLASRLRIVTAADEARRSIERNLHDGAQQHLVALAVKLGLARQLLDSDQTMAETLLEELRADVQVTLTELRALAHGIYPPLLRDRGIGEALRNAANRSALPTVVEAADVGRYPTEVEAAVYFCCLEAMQNAGKHATSATEVVVSVCSTTEVLTFAVTDDGPGFDPSTASESHGFTNMRDRLGAVGGTLKIDSAPGAGTRICGSIPSAPLAVTSNGG